MANIFNLMEMGATSSCKESTHAILVARYKMDGLHVLSKRFHKMYLCDIISYTIVSISENPVILNISMISSDTLVSVIVALFAFAFFCPINSTRNPAEDT